MFRQNLGFFLGNMVRFSLWLLVLSFLGIELGQVVWSQRPDRRDAGGAFGKLDKAPKEPEAEPADPDELRPAPRENYEDIAVNETLKNQTAKVRVMLTTGKFSAASDQTLFDQYLTEYFLPRWTQYKEWKENWKIISNLQSYRKELHARIDLARAAEVFDYLNELVLDFMNNLASGDYHPAVRLNAMLMIGELNGFDDKTGRKSDVPLPAALNVLLSAVQISNFPTRFALRRWSESSVMQKTALSMRKLAGRSPPPCLCWPMPRCRRAAPRRAASG